MGRGKAWSRQESEAVAKAWRLAATEIVAPKEQNTKRFATELYRHFIQFSPRDSDPIDGRWDSRSQTAVKTQFDAICDDILKFNVIYHRVMELAVDRGLAPDDVSVLRAAIALHLGLTSFSAITFQDVKTVEADWKLYEAWCALRSCERFAPMPLSKPPTKISTLPKDASEVSLPPPPPPKVPFGRTSPSVHASTPVRASPPPRASPTSTRTSPSPQCMVTPRDAVDIKPVVSSAVTNSRPDGDDDTDTADVTIAADGRDSTSNGASTTDGGSHPASGNTPMRTLASAALAMPVPCSSHPRDHSSGTFSPFRRPPPPQVDASREAPQVRIGNGEIMAEETVIGETPHGPVENKDGSTPATYYNSEPALKRRLQPDEDCNMRDDDSVDRTRQGVKIPRLSNSFFDPSPSAAEMITKALHSLGDALSEHNAITLFCHPDMQGREDQRIFFNILAEKHILKAQMDRDQLSRQLERIHTGNGPSKSHG